MKKKIAVLALLSTLVPIVASAVTPRAMLEKSSTYALNGTVHAFRVPTVDSLGKIKFYDIAMDLTVNTDGTISPSANVTANPSIQVTSGVITPGTYRETGGTDTCTVFNITLTNGRIQSFFTCKNGANTFEFSVATGPIAAGHPYLAELNAQKVNTRTDVATQTWGMITNGSVSLGTCGDANYNAGHAIGTKTNGNQIVVSLITRLTADQPNTICGNILTKI